MNENDIKELGELKAEMRNMRQDFRDHLDDHKEKDKTGTDKNRFNATTIIALLILILEAMNTISNAYGSTGMSSNNHGIERTFQGEAKP